LLLVVCTVVLLVLARRHDEKVLDTVVELVAVEVMYLLTTTEDVARMPVDTLANKLVLVSGGVVRGTELEPLINLSWSGDDLRRLSVHQASHPRDEPGLMAYTRDHIALVAPETDVRTLHANPDRPKYLGCQWNLYDRSGGGFVEKPLALRSRFRGESSGARLIPFSPKE
jgi:hypothetical protein